jgi:mRNA interferase HicA
VKRRDLIKKLSKAAASAGVECGVVVEGSEHTIYQVGKQKLSIPRHREINELTAEGIMKDAEGELGRRWWR